MDWERRRGGRGGLKEGAGVLGISATGRAGEISSEMLGGSCASGIRRKGMALARGAGPSAERSACSAGEWAEQGAGPV